VVRLLQTSNPEAGHQHQTCCFGHSSTFRLMTDTREFSRIKALAKTCAIETFEKAEALAFFKIPQC